MPPLPYGNVHGEVFTSMGQETCYKKRRLSVVRKSFKIWPVANASRTGPEVIGQEVARCTLGQARCGTPFFFSHKFELPEDWRRKFLVCAAFTGLIVMQSIPVLFIITVRKNSHTF